MENRQEAVDRRSDDRMPSSDPAQNLMTARTEGRASAEDSCSEDKEKSSDPGQKSMTATARVEDRAVAEDRNSEGEETPSDPARNTGSSHPLHKGAPSNSVAATCRGIARAHSRVSLDRWHNADERALSGDAHGRKVPVNSRVHTCGAGTPARKTDGYIMQQNRREYPRCGDALALRGHDESTQRQDRAVVVQSQGHLDRPSVQGQKGEKQHTEEGKHRGREPGCFHLGRRRACVCGCCWGGCGGRERG